MSCGKRIAHCSEPACGLRRFESKSALWRGRSEGLSVRVTSGHFGEQERTRTLLNMRGDGTMKSRCAVAFEAELEMRACVAN